LAIVAILIVTFGYLFCGPTPRFGNQLPLKDETPRTVQIKFFTQEETTSDAMLCANIHAALRNARGGGPVCACPSLGNITFQYEDHSKVIFYLQPGHWMGRVDITLDGHSYSIAGNTLFSSLEAAGISRSPR
jgi:hypothetical protein